MTFANRQTTMNPILDFGIDKSEVVGDHIIALDAAFKGGPGILQIAGTGTNCVGRAPDAWAPALAVLPYQGWNEPVLFAPELARPVANGPPLICGVPVFLRNCNFRI